jgi:hypothetical protein
MIATVGGPKHVGAKTQVLYAVVGNNTSVKMLYFVFTRAKDILLDCTEICCALYYAGFMLHLL